jgi:ABC-type amino acid transport system permease subunit
MLNFLARRVVQLIPTLFFVSILIFSLQQLLPGDPALVMAGEERDPDVIAQIRQQYRLDQPVPVQYVYWIKGVLSGDFGESLRNKVPVRELIAQKLPVTMQLASMAIIIAFLIGIPAGIVSAVKKGTAWDYGANFFALWGISTPNFWLGIMLIFLFSIKLGWLPASGYVPLTENWRASIAATIMPAFVLGNAIAAILMRHTRSAMLQVLESVVPVGSVATLSVVMLLAAGAAATRLCVVAARDRLLLRAGLWVHLALHGIRALSPLGRCRRPAVCRCRGGSCRGLRHHRRAVGFRRRRRSGPTITAGYERQRNHNGHRPKRHCFLLLRSPRCLQNRGPLSRVYHAGREPTPNHHRRRQLSAAELADRPRQAGLEGAAGARAGNLARRRGISRAGAGRRDAARRPRYGKRRHRHHHRRRDAA